MWKKTQIAINTIYLHVFYGSNTLLQNPKIIEFVNLDRKATIYGIYNKTFLTKIINQLKFSNLVIIQNKKEYSNDNLHTCFFSSPENTFKIEDKNKIDFNLLFGKTDDNKEINLEKT